MKQPKALKVFFLTEMWERFAYYAIQSLLVLFMKKTMHLSDSQAYSIFGALGALLYVTPVFGGYVADRFLGYKNAVILGGIFLALGYFLLATSPTHYFYFALSCLVAGNGFFKPNVSAAVGNLYEVEDKRRDNGFTLFYLGINIGSASGSILCGYINDTFGFPITFFVTTVALLLGVFIFIFGLRYFPQVNAKISARINWLPFIFIFCGSLFIIFLTSLLLQHPNLTSLLVMLFGVALVIFILKKTLHYSRKIRSRLIVCLVLTLFATAFYALYMQMPMTLTLFIDRVVNRHILGITIPTSAFFAFDGVAIILFTPFFITLWKTLAAFGKDPSFPMKFFWGILITGVGFLVVVLGILLSPHHQLISGGWIIASYFTQTLGELCLSPIGLSMVTLLSPPEMRGMMMGVWFFNISVAAAVAGSIAKLASVPDSIQNIDTIRTIYLHAFLKFGLMTIVIAFILLLLVPKLKRAIA
jgi:POT family proton-dependent oligopeptide transporter